MDLNKLREQLERSRPVRVTRDGRLEVDDSKSPAQAGERPPPSRLKRHTFADARLARDAVELLAHSRARSITVDGRPSFEEWVVTDFGVEFHFVFVVPEHYPYQAPSVYCLQPEVPALISHHVYACGSLCLYQPGEWTPDLTLLDIRNWTCEWAFNVVPKLYGHDVWMSPEHK